MFTVPSINAIGKGAISRVSNLFLATKSESKKQSEEPESTKPSKSDWTSGELREVCSDLGVAVVTAPKSRNGFPVSFKQSVPRGKGGLLRLFLSAQAQCGIPQDVRHVPLPAWEASVIVWGRLERGSQFGHSACINPSTCGVVFLPG